MVELSDSRKNRSAFAENPESLGGNIVLAPFSRTYVNRSRYAHTDPFLKPSHFGPKNKILGLQFHLPASRRKPIFSSDSG
ncbi:hypothetical protein LEP1GSC047_1960 [Leptospira inadai serovar Lyme str. 10]|uniref:Uncharacterized protein n=1 Tax=Leptospira inadai serovar Lyme str. 10 TaxID=1049790 RepID=V6HGS0_9LEPT|nr:hypothetical protein LEP1GSC047_1960 [Leptospira inadai serovar Lyme str. 10]